MTHILITGASSGIGAALAVDYAAPGICLSLHGRSAERLAAVAASARAKGAVTETFQGDVTDAASMAAWIDKRDKAEPLDIVIANAGISAGTNGLLNGAEPVKRILDVNVMGVLNTVAPAATHMTARGRGQIALIASLAGYRGFAGSGAYGASKAAVRIYGEALRAELAPQGVGVSIICPGFIKTPMTDVNPFLMPFLMPVERASRIIRSGVAQNRAIIAFPWPMHLLVRFMALLPLDWVARATRGRPIKPPVSAI